MSWICPKCETENPDSLKVCEVCDSPRESSPGDILKERLKEKYSDEAYRTFIRYNYRLLESADKGNAIDQYRVGEWFFSRGNLGTEDNYSKIAVFWFQKAAIRGHVDSQFKLASCYEEGRGVPQIKDESIKWYKKAASEGDDKALQKYISLKYDGKSYERALMYRFSLVVSADKGDRNSQYQLGEWFYNHSKYKDLAVEWLTRAAKSGHDDAMYKLGICYEEGAGITKSYNQTLEWHRKAATRGNKAARLKLADSYLYGKMVKKDVVEAIKWYGLAGKGISGADLNNIGYSYDVGDGVQMDKTKAVDYYRRAAEKGDMVALYNLGVCYENGSGVTKDINIAKKWYEKAAAQGENQAQQCVNRINSYIYYQEQSDKGFICYLVTGVVAIMGLILLFVQPDDSWIHDKLVFDCEKGVCLWIGSIIMTYLVTKNIIGYEGE